MQDPAIRELLERASSSDWTVARDALDELAYVLRGATPRPEDAADAGRRLTTLARHGKWEVRKAVAHAAQFLRDDSFRAALAPLVDDPNALVREAARRVLARRTGVARSGALRGGPEELVQRWLQELEDRHGRTVRQAAQRIADKSIEAFVRTACHELDRVATAHDLTLQQLEQHLPRGANATWTTYLERAFTNSSNLIAVVELLRGYAEQFDPEFQAERLHEIVTDALHGVCASDPEKTENLAFDNDVPRGIVLEAHRPGLLRAFTNLVQNAVESYDGLGKTPWVRVEAKLDGETSVVLAVTDKGCGISEDNQADLFRLFATRKTYGHGLGLVITRRIVETLHGGSISIKSDVGVGTTVTLVLPREQEPRS